MSALQELGLGHECAEPDDTMAHVLGLARGDYRVESELLAKDSVLLAQEVDDFELAEVDPGRSRTANEPRQREHFDREEVRGGDRAQVRLSLPRGLAATAR
jgi:hypothetical protein